MADHPIDDPPPIPPERPAASECCNSGCDPCVLDLYEQALDRYRAACAAWQTRQSSRSCQPNAPASPDGSTGKTP